MCVVRCEHRHGFWLALIWIVICLWGTIASAQDPAKQDPQQIDMNWPPKSIAEIKVDPRDLKDEKPKDLSAALIDKAAPNNWHNQSYPETWVTWVAPDIHYGPLYFEDAALERYGQQRFDGQLQMVASGTRFGAQFLASPFNAAIAGPRACEYPLGFCRPGSPVPPSRQRIIYSPQRVIFHR